MFTDYPLDYAVLVEVIKSERAGLKWPAKHRLDARGSVGICRERDTSRARPPNDSNLRHRPPFSISRNLDTHRGTSKDSKETAVLVDDCNVPF